jgi:flagellar hook-associated protein 1 FlgK
MRMSFSGLEIALSGLYTSQKALDIANHNISNAATPGYTRQVGEISANKAYTVYDGSGMVGTGSQLTGITQIRDSFLDYRYWSESCTSGEWNVKETALEDFESLFNEQPSNTGFTKVMNDFYTSLQDLSSDTGNLSTRAAVKEKAVSLAKYFNNMASNLKQSQRDDNLSVKSKVDEVNSYAQQIRDLNELIYKTELDKNVANDLRDKRQLLVDKLSKIVDVKVDEKTYGTLGNGVEDKRFSVTINGIALVNHTNVNEIVYTQRAPADRQNTTDIDGLYDIKWKDGNSIKLTGGELKAYIDIRDGNGDTTSGSKNAYKGVPFYMEKLNTFAKTFAESLNEGMGTDKGFADGYGLDGSTGIKLFTANGSSSASFTDYSTITAENIGVSQDILDTKGLYKIPASSTISQTGNNLVIEDILKQRHNSTMFDEGTPEDYMKSLAANLAVDSKEANDMNKAQSLVVKQVQSRRDQVSGVSLEEEMTNVIKYQQIYSASAQLISVMNQIYDVTVNGLGNVG